MMTYSLPKRVRRNLEVAEMRDNRLLIEPLYQEIGDLAYPFRLKLNQADFRTSASRRTSQIYNSLATKCLRTFESGLMTCATDPTSEWVGLTTKDPDRAEYGPHRVWLDDVGGMILSMISDCNAYRNLPRAYGNSGCFGVFAMGMYEDMRMEARSPLTTQLYDTGRYWYAEDDYGTANGFYEECRATIRQMYLRFGKTGTFSAGVQRAIDRGEWEKWVDVAHKIEPNEDYVPGSPLSRRKQFAECWYELGNSSTKGTYQSDYTVREEYIIETGRDVFPILIGKWSATAGETYPVEFPGSECLSDNKSLQIGEKRIWQYLEKLVHPHWIADAGLRGELDGGWIPGETSYVTEKEAGKSVRPAHLVDPAALSPMRENMDAVSQRIMEAFHYPTFATFDSLPDKERTATEILERKSEKLLKLTDMYTNLQIGVLRPLVDYCFYLLVKNNMLPPVPPDLQGHKLEYRFNGVLAQAQKANRAQPVRSALQVVQELAVAQMQAGRSADVLDKFDTDQAVDEICTDWGVPASVIRDDATVAAIRQQRAQAQAAQQKLQAMQQLSETARNLGNAPLKDGDGDENALGALVNQ